MSPMGGSSSVLKFILTQELNELGGTGDQGALDNACDIPAALDWELFYLQDSQSMITNFALHSRLREHAHPQTCRYRLFDCFDMPEHHPNLERHPGNLEQFLYGGSRSRADLAEEENFISQAGQRHLGLHDQSMLRGGDRHQGISQEWLGHQPFDSRRPASYHKINLSCQQASTNISAVRHAQVESNVGSAPVKGAQKMGQNVGSHRRFSGNAY